MTLRFVLNEQVEIHQPKVYEITGMKNCQIRHPGKSDFYNIFSSLLLIALKGKDHALMP